MIHVESLNRSFGDKQVLFDINTRMQAGEVSAIIGGSGSGKSVFLKHLIGLYQPDSGRVVVDGRDLSRASHRELLELRKSFGMLFQNAALFDSMNVADNIAFPMREHRRWSEREIARRVREKLDVVGLGAVEHQFPAELSGGMRKRVGLARALAIDPQIVLYDEPTTGLDPIMSRTIHELIRTTNDRLGVTSIVISHDMRGALAIADSIIVLHEGRIRVQGSVEQVRASDDEVLRTFLAYDLGE